MFHFPVHPQPEPHLPINAISTLCGLQVISPWVARRHNNVTCQKCRNLLYLLEVRCLVCPFVGKVKDTKIWNGLPGLLMTNKLTFRRYCPKCPADRPSPVVDLRGDQVCLPPQGRQLDGGETDEARHGIMMRRR